MFVKFGYTRTIIWLIVCSLENFKPDLKVWTHLDVLVFRSISTLNQLQYCSNSSASVGINRPKFYFGKLVVASC